MSNSRNAVICLRSLFPPPLRNFLLLVVLSSHFRLSRRVSPFGDPTVSARLGPGSASQGPAITKFSPERPIPDHRPLPPFGFAVRRNCYARARVPDCGQGSCPEVASKQEHVQTNSDRKSRRDCLPGH